MNWIFKYLEIILKIIDKTSETGINARIHALQLASTEFGGRSSSDLK